MQLGRFLSRNRPAPTGRRNGRQYSLRMPLYQPGMKLVAQVSHHGSTGPDDGISVYIPIPDIRGHLDLRSTSPVGRRCYCEGRVYRIDKVSTDRRNCDLTLTLLRARSFDGFVPAGTVFVVAIGLKALDCPTMAGKYEVCLGGCAGDWYSDQTSLAGFQPTRLDLVEWNQRGKPACPIMLLRGHHMHALSNGSSLRGEICQFGDQVFEICQNGDASHMRCLVLKPRPDLEPYTGETYAEYKREMKKVTKRCRTASGRARHLRRANHLMKRVRREHGLRA